ncbi:MAG: C39 family peptidase [Pseudomonadales bacterium]
MRVLTLLFFLLFIHFKAQAIELSGFSVGGNYSIPVVSFNERKFTTVYKQKYDFSCGSAALASLLTFHYEDDISEQSVFIDMYQKGNKSKIQQQGFSLLDMKYFLERRGYQSDGFRMSLDNLKVPAITIINNNGYLHFVIIKGARNTEVLVGDPSVGVKVVPRNDFIKMWEKRILFLIRDDKSIASQHFQDSREWNVRVKAPLETVISRTSLGAFNLLQPGNYDF